MSQGQFSAQAPLPSTSSPTRSPTSRSSTRGWRPRWRSSRITGSRPDYGESTYRGSGRLKGKRALITGGDSGIGRVVALAYAREGADVLISYLPEEEDDAQVTARASATRGVRP